MLFSFIYFILFIEGHINFIGDFSHYYFPLLWLYKFMLILHGTLAVIIFIYLFYFVDSDLMPCYFCIGLYPLSFFLYSWLLKMMSFFAWDLKHHYSTFSFIVVIYFTWFLAINIFAYFVYLGYFTTSLFCMVF